MNNSLARRALAVTVALSGIAGGTVVAAPAANAYTNYYGAIAMNGDGAYGRATDYPSQYAAETAALDSCGYNDCVVLASYVNGCGAAAYSGVRYWGGTGSDLWTAESYAISAAGGGSVTAWACTSNHS
jgi:hypothetical protein